MADDLTPERVPEITDLPATEARDRLINSIKIRDALLHRHRVLLVDHNHPAAQTYMRRIRSLNEQIERDITALTTGADHWRVGP